MDTDALVAHARARFDHEVAKRILKEKYQARMLFAYRGGMWRAGPELHSMIFTCGKMDTAVLPDVYENPVRVDLKELISMSQQRWQEQMNAWLVEHEQNQSKR